MELKLSVSIGGTLQVKNAKGEWDWIKPEVGCEIKLFDGEIKIDSLQTQFAVMWEEVVGPQFQSVVQELLNDQIPKVEEVAVEETNTEEDVVAVTTSEDEYY